MNFLTIGRTLFFGLLTVSSVSRVWMIPSEGRLAAGPCEASGACTCRAEPDRPFMGLSPLERKATALPSLPADSLARYEYTQMHMGVAVRMVVYADDEKRAA